MLEKDSYKDRQNYEMEHWPELRESMNNLQAGFSDPQGFWRTQTTHFHRRELSEWMPALPIAWLLPPACHRGPGRENSGPLELSGFRSIFGTGARRS